MLNGFKYYFLLILIVTILGCTPQEKVENKNHNVVKVDVATVLKSSVIDWYQYTTRLESPKQVELRPRVTGLVESVAFKEGDFIEKGEVLFRLDNRTFLANVNNLEAQVARAEAALRQAKNESLRGKMLSKQKAISTESVEARVYHTAQREAELAALQASLTSAKLELEFTLIKAPISGKISFATVTEGNTVKANETLLTTIMSMNELYAYFDIDERTWNENFSQLTSSSNIPVKLNLLGVSSGSKVGVVDFIDNTINENTGTLKVRATFLNSDNHILPGAFARVSLTPSVNSAKIIVPDRAIGTDLKNRFVLIVDENNTLQYRKVLLGKRYGEYRAIFDGIKEGERIAINGPGKVGPGMPIMPRMVEVALPQEFIDVKFETETKNNISQAK